MRIKSKQSKKLENRKAKKLKQNKHERQSEGICVAATIGHKRQTRHTNKHATQQERFQNYKRALAF